MTSTSATTAPSPLLRDVAPLLWLALGTFATGTESFMISPLLPGLAADFSVNVAAAGQLVTAFAFTYAISSPLLSAATGGIARRKLLILAMAAFALANFIASTTTGYWQQVRYGYAYGTATSSVPQGATNTILRLDLRTGQSVDYFSYPSVQSSVAGFDYTGRPVIYVQGQNQGQQVFLIYLGSSTPGRGTLIGNLVGSNFWPNGAPVADTHGLWFASGNGIALFVDGGGWYSMSAIGGQLAGGCA